MRILIVCLPAVFGLSELNAQKVAQKTNALYWATATPNIGVEFAIAPRFTMEFNTGYNPWELSGKSSLKHWLAHSGIRYWFCRSFERHFISIDASYGRYDIGYLSFPNAMKDVAYDGKLYGGGLSYGYHLPLGKRWGFEFTLGVGYMYLQYDKYTFDECKVVEGSYKRHYVGPTRLGLSFVYMLR